MRYATTIILKGLGAVLPVALTIYLVYWLGSTLETFLRPVIVSVTPPGYYWPGMGLAAGILLLFLIGLIVDAWIVRRLIGAGELLLEKIPLIKTVYGGLRDFMAYFSRMRENKELKRVVTVTFGGSRLIGFITSEEGRLPMHFATEQDSMVAVYLPMSYQIGGFTVYVPRDTVETIDMPVEDAMRLVLTAGLSNTAGSSRKD